MADSVNEQRVERRICPLLSAGSDIRFCKESRCAWWDGDAGCCAVRNL